MGLISVKLWLQTPRPNLETTCFAFSLRMVSDFMDHLNFYSYISSIL